MINDRYMKYTVPKNIKRKEVIFTNKVSTLKNDEKTVFAGNNIFAPVVAEAASASNANTVLVLHLLVVVVPVAGNDLRGFGLNQ